MSLLAGVLDETSTATASGTGDMRLHGAPLAFARVIWLLVTTGVVTLEVAGIPATYAKLQTVCSNCPADSGTPTPNQAQALHAMGLSLRFWASFQISTIIVATVVYIGTGVLLFVRRSDDRMALFASLMLVTFGGAVFTGTAQALPDFQPALWLPVYSADALGQIAFVVFFVIFPDGRLVPRWVALPTLLWSFSWIAGLFRNPQLDQVAHTINSGPFFPVIIASVIIAQVYRYRRVSTPREREQTKWVVYGFALGIGGFLLMLFIGNVVILPSTHGNPILQLIANGVIDAFFLFVPVAIAIAVLRSGLWDIDVIIQRTLVYGTLTALLAAVYFSCVVGAQAVVQAVTGQVGTPTVVIVGSTLLIAALFNPLRRRIQTSIDRRFYRRKYDAAKTLEAFSATLRSETDLNALSEHLVGVVEQTMQPAHVALWLRAEPNTASQSRSARGGRS
jgi:hypothetical protein